MITKEYIIMAPQGLHARPATALVRLAKNYKSVINLQKAGKTIGINSMLNILSMTIKGGESITINIDGADESEAATALDLFFTEHLREL
jgi:phosphocarrier protein HPr